MFQRYFLCVVVLKGRCFQYVGCLFTLMEKHILWRWFADAGEEVILDSEYPLVLFLSFLCYLKGTSAETGIQPRTIFSLLKTGYYIVRYTALYTAAVPFLV